MSGLCHGLLSWFGHCLPVSHSRASSALPKVRFFPHGVIYPDLSDFYSVLLNKMSVIVYICVSGIADHRAKLSYTAVVFSVNAGRSEACSGR